MAVRSAAQRAAQLKAAKASAAKRRKRGGSLKRMVSEGRRAGARAKRQDLRDMGPGNMPGDRKKKKPYAKKIGSRNRNGKFANKSQRRKNIAKKVATGAAVGAYIAVNAYAANVERGNNKRRRANIKSGAAKKTAHYQRVASASRGAVRVRAQ